MRVFVVLNSTKLAFFIFLGNVLFKLRGMNQAIGRQIHICSQLFFFFFFVNILMNSSFQTAFPAWSYLPFIICNMTLGTCILSQSIQAIITKYCRLSGFQTTEMYFSQFWRLVVPRQRHLFLVLCPHTVEGAGKLSGASFIKALILYMRAPLS